MENRAHALVAGLFTLLLGAALAVVAFWFSKDDVRLVPYMVSTNTSVAGLKVEAPVRYRGVEVGKVQSIRIDPGRSFGAGALPVELGFFFRQRQPDVRVNQGALADVAARGAGATGSLARRLAEQGAGQKKRRGQLSDAGRPVEDEGREDPARLQGALERGRGPRLPHDEIRQRQHAERAHSGAPRVVRKRSIASTTR